MVGKRGLGFPAARAGSKSIENRKGAQQTKPLAEEKIGEKIFDLGGRKGEAMARGGRANLTDPLMSGKGLRAAKHASRGVAHGREGCGGKLNSRG